MRCDIASASVTDHHGRAFAKRHNSDSKERQQQKSHAKFRPEQRINLNYQISYCLVPPHKR